MGRTIRTGNSKASSILVVVLGTLVFATSSSAPATRSSTFDPERVIQGNFQTYAAGPYGAYTGMWGRYLPQNDTLAAESSMRVTPGTFPRGTTFWWDVTPDPDWNGVNGYLHVAWGNYDDSPGAITPQQVKNIAALDVSIDWSYNGDPSSGLLSECWLTPTPTPSGVPDRQYEVAFFPRVSSAGASYLASLPVVGGGSFTDSNGNSWNVREGVSGTGQPYYIAYRPSYVEFRGTLPYKDYFAFLAEAGKITGSEWFNGLAFGVEPFSGSASLAISDLTVHYTRM
ncbi:hypothetical protein GCM10023200_01710 [Actinomycetospora chlora]|uniref:Uncharacterized protein n=1 Tax=Actinomycetospora chlora TaxID=663608 RepID=A0ABP9A3L7_9PSEU